MYIFIVKLQCLNKKNDPFFESFQVIANDEKDAIYKAKEKARKEGFLLNYFHDARQPEVEQL